MDELVCEKCEATYQPGAEFCRNGHYVGWDDPPRVDLEDAKVTPKDLPSKATSSVPPRIDLSSRDVVLEPDGVLEVRVLNKSEIVEGYVVDLIEPPTWLSAESSDINLKPDTADQMSITFKAAAKPLVEAQRVSVRLRIRTKNDPQAFAEADVSITVPRVGKVVSLEPRPNMVRITDTTTGSFELVIDNAASNYEQHLELSGSDPEAVVTFHFSPSKAVVPAGRAGVVGVRFEAPAPKPGQDATRQLTVRAANEMGTAPASVTVVHKTSAPTPRPLTVAKIRLEPEQLKIRDSDSGRLNLHIENKHGSLPLRARLAGTDPENAVQFKFEPPAVDIPPGEIARSTLTVKAPPPPSGQEVVRQIRVAVHDGGDAVEASGTVTQITSMAAISVAKIRLEPEQVTTRDVATGRLNVIVENRDRARRLRVGLSGSDPERAVHFTFSPMTLDIPPFQTVHAVLTVSAAPPPSGKQLTRRLTVTARDIYGSIDALGTLVQSTSDAPISTAGIWLQPQQIHARGSTGRSAVVIDNTRGSLPLQVSLGGRDAEGVVRLTFDPTTAVVYPGETGVVRMTASARRPGGGQQVIRNLRISATDGRQSVETNGALIQTAPDRWPLFRFLLTLLGGLIAIYAAGAGPPNSARLPEAVPYDLDLLGWSVGTVIVLVIVMMLGLTSSTGKLSRTCSVLLFLGAFGYGAFLLSRHLDWAPIVGVAAGAVIAYLGGLFVRR